MTGLQGKHTSSRNEGEDFKWNARTTYGMNTRFKRFLGPTAHLLLKFLPMGTAVVEARASNAECKPQLVHPVPGTHVSELPVSNKIFRRRADKREEASAPFSLFKQLLSSVVPNRISRERVSLRC